MGVQKGPMPTFDPAATDIRILACAHCGEPVSGKPIGNTLELDCGYCETHDVRELRSTTSSVPVERAYRGRAPRDKRAKIVLDMSVPPEGLERFARVTIARRAELERAWREMLSSTREEDDAELDRKITFLGFVLSNLHHLRNDAVRARAVLESTLEHVHLPAFRALVLSRLSVSASRARGVELAQKWLDLVPEGVRAVEVESAERIARAWIARTKNDPKGMLDAIGQGNTLDEFVPPFRSVAVALRMDAHEQRGEHRMAYGVWTASRSDSRNVLFAIRQYGLAPKTHRRIVTLGFAAIFVIGLLLATIASVTLSLTRGQPISMPLLALGFGGAIAIFIARRLMQP